jgi:Integrase core domain
MFRLSVETVARWEMEAMSPVGEGPRPLVAPAPPVRRFADVVRALVKTMELAGFGGNDLIARTLARSGWRLSSRTVGRIRRERWPSPPPPEAASGVPRAVRAKRPNHVWMVDLTDVKGLFGLVTFKVAVVFDAFSRMPLSVRVFSKEASALEIAWFVSRTARRHGRPAHFVSDQARCFKGQVFRRKLRGCRAAMGIAGRPWGLETRVTPSVPFSIPPRRPAFFRDGSLSCALFARREAAVRLTRSLFRTPARIRAHQRSPSRKGSRISTWKPLPF